MPGASRQQSSFALYYDRPKARRRGDRVALEPIDESSMEMRFASGSVASDSMIPQR